jgi:hypothetical protein
MRDKLYRYSLGICWGILLGVMIESCSVRKNFESLDYNNKQLFELSMRRPTWVDSYPPGQAPNPKHEILLDGGWVAIPPSKDHPPKHARRSR